MARLTAIATVVAALFLLATVPAGADTRVALVIGNAAYRNVAPLENPGRDARAMAAALQALGFDTTLALDQDGGGLKQALRRFTTKARSADIAAVYYAGHGIEAGGENYLIPVDATLQSDDDIDYELVPLELVLKAVAGAKQLRLVMLDACRNNPFSAQMAKADGTRGIGRGFVRVEPANNTLVAYAAKDGTTADDGDGEHSPFAAALLKRLPDPGVEITFLFRKVRDDVLAATGGKQEPFVYGSMGGDPVYLVAAAPPPPAPAPAPAPAPVAQVDPKALDLSYWTAIQGSENPALYEGYLKRFPDGTFSELAKAKLEQLKAAAPKETQTATLAPPPIEVESLDATYVVKQTANVRAEPNATAKLLGKLAPDEGVAVTGRVKGKAWLRIQQGADTGYVSAGQLAPVDAAEIADWQALQIKPTFESAQAFLQKYPAGYFKERATAIAARLAPPPPAPPAPEIEPLAGTYIATQSANIRAEPSASAKTLGRLNAEDAVVVTGKLKGGDWLRVEREGQAAFVSAKLLQKIDENELKAWRQLNAAPKLDVVEAFLERYPQGYFKPKAQALKVSLQPEVQPGPPASTPAPMPEPAIAAVAPVVSDVKVGNVYLLWTILKTDDPKAAIGAKQYEFKDRIEVVSSSGDGTFIGKSQQLPVVGDLRLTAKAGALKIEFYTSAGRGEFRLQKLADGEFGAFGGSGSVDFSMNESGAVHYEGKARMTPMSKSEWLPEATPQADTSAPAQSQDAAVTPPAAPAPSNEIKVGDAYKLHAVLRCRCFANAAAPKTQAFDGIIKIMSAAGSGSFDGETSDLGAGGDASSISVEQSEGAITIRVATRDGPVVFSLNRVAPGRYAGRGKAAFTNVSGAGGDPYLGDATLTLLQ